MDYNFYQKSERKMNFGLIPILIFVSVLLVLSFFFNFFIEYLQIKEINQSYTTVFWTNFNAKMLSQTLSFIFVFILLLINTLIIRKNILSYNSDINVIKKVAPIVLMSFILSFLASSFISQSVYNRILLFLNSTPFNQGDPIFNQDIGYYMFLRPFWISFTDSIKGVWLFVIAFTIILYSLFYVFMGLLNFGDILKEKGIMIHIIVNIIIYFLIRATTYKFLSESILYSPLGEVTGAGYTDIYVWKVYYKIAPFLLIALVIISIIFARMAKYKNAIISIAIFPIFFIIALLVSGVVQRLFVSPNEALVEEPYIKYNIEATKNAYNLNSITEKEFPIKYNLTAQDLKDNSTTIQNIRITDFPQTLVTLNQLQGIRNYYSFMDSDINVYNINGKKVALNVAVREMNKENLDNTAKKYINKKMRYTHGFGVAANPINKITEQGQPVFWIKDIPPKSYNGAPEIKQPRVYFGELTNDYVIVNSKQKELDYSEGQTDYEFSYDGKSGIPLNLFNRIIFSAKYGDISMLLSGYITNESKLLINRNIMERVKKIAPFLTYDTDPNIIINSEGKLKWVIDGYTTSNYYPYSQSYNGINYIRNSVKIIVDAYDGTVNFYIVDYKDPIIVSYSKIYPSLFSKEPIPQDIRDKIRYPEYLFKIQATIYEKYHMSNPKQLYNKADLWSIAKEKYQKDLKEVDPYYNLMKIEQGKEEELVLMLPYTLRNKDNMVAWLGVRSEGDNYGKMVAYTFPKGENVYGTLQIENKIDNDPVISKEFTLWGQGGSEVVRGNLLVIPIKDSILYVEPIYITSQNQASMPEVKRVVVAYNDKIVMEQNLELALSKLFDVSFETENNAGQQIINIEDGVDKLIDKTIDAYSKIQGQLKQNDWEGFGKTMKELNSLIELLKQKKTSNP